MNKRNLYYLSVFKRTNLIKAAILSFFLMIASWPQLVLAVFFRSHMGQRHMSLATSITIYLLMFFGGSMPRYSYYGGWSFPGLSDIFGDTPSVAIFALAFLAMSILRYRETVTEPGVFDFAKFSLYTGDILPFFYKFKVNGKEPSRKLIATVYEPLVGLIAGILMTSCGSPVGAILIACSIIYSLSYVGAYHLGDLFLIDKIDEIICNEDLSETLIEGRKPEDGRGVEFFGTAPASKQFRRVLAESMIEANPAVEVH